MTMSQSPVTPSAGSVALPGVAGVAPTCRVTVVTPYARVDVALPVQATLAELIPQLIRLSGAEGQASAENPGWVLSRLGGAPLAIGMTVTGSGIRDGDVLYLNPRERHAVPLLFDDVIDAIASAAESRTGAWGPKVAYRLGVTAMAAIFVGATLLLLRGLWGEALAPIGVGAFAVLLLLGAGALGRAYADVEAGAVCAAAGLPAALLAGMTVPPPHVVSLAAGQLGFGLAALTVYGVLVVVVLGARLAWFLCVTVAAAIGAIATAVVLLAGSRPVGSAGVTAVLVTALAMFAPMISLRLARLPLPKVPADMDSFRAGEQATMGQAVLDQTSAAAGILTGLLGSFGLVVFGSVVVLLRGDSPWQAGLAGVLGVVWLLRSRSYAGSAQRTVLVAVGVLVLAWLGGWLANNGSPSTVVVAAVALAGAGVVCLLYANRVVHGRRSPYWSRLLDVAEFLSLMAMVPVTGMVIGLYDAIRGVL
ncbi:MAG TPA: type VII secretion integral membrane protein EccD [Pseudonocardiaceae bacterium]|nr:type VII secretion integral membrane protein EccD [Pseudonocardiaceae bacterium]